MTSTTWNPRPSALELWTVPELVAFHMYAAQPLTLCDDGHEPTVERAGLCEHYYDEPDEDEDGGDYELCYGRGTCCCSRCDR